MTASPDDYKAGYGRPPRETRWKKGQSGNPAKKPKRQESIVDMVDRLLLSHVELSLNGEVKSITALEAIISQLQLKEISGNTRATRILLKYRAFASQCVEKQFQLVFTDSENMGAASHVTPRTGNG